MERMKVDADVEFCEPFLWIGATAAGAFAGWGTGLVLGGLIAVLAKTGLGSFNGSRFRFQNKDFERQGSRSCVENSTAPSLADAGGYDLCVWAPARYKGSQHEERS